jgi:YggT family protein
MLLTVLFVFLDLLLFVLNWLIIIRMVLSWFMKEGRLTAMLADLTEPVIAPVRSIMPGTGTIDLAPLVTLLIIDAIRYFLFYL